MTERKQKIILIIVGVILLLYVVGIIANNYMAIDEYNNGACAQCNVGHYRLVGTPTRHYHFYTYSCDYCNHVLTSSAPLN